jgi:hypothetical protein
MSTPIWVPLAFGYGETHEVRLSLIITRSSLRIKSLVPNLKGNYNFTHTWDQNDYQRLVGHWHWTTGYLSPAASTRVLERVRNLVLIAVLQRADNLLGLM